MHDGTEDMGLFGALGVVLMLGTLIVGFLVMVGWMVYEFVLHFSFRLVEAMVLGTLRWFGWSVLYLIGYCLAGVVLAGISWWLWAAMRD